MLQALNGLYEIHVYTMGVRAYAEEVTCALRRLNIFSDIGCWLWQVLKVLDPDNSVIKRRVVTRDDCPGRRALRCRSRCCARGWR